MTEIHRRIYWRARVLRDLALGDREVHLDRDVILESDVAPGTHWVLQEQGFEDLRISLEYLEIHKCADITFQSNVTIIMD